MNKAEILAELVDVFMLVLIYGILLAVERTQGFEQAVIVGLGLAVYMGAKDDE